MATYHLPEFDELINRFAARVGECAADLYDFRQALQSSNSPEAIIDEYESLGLLRQITEDCEIN